MNGHTITEDEALLLCHLSEKDQVFNISQFMQSILYHMISFIFSFPIAVLIMYIFEGFDLHLAYNMQFYGRQTPRIVFTCIFALIPVHIGFNLKWYLEGNENPALV